MAREIRRSGCSLQRGRGVEVKLRRVDAVARHQPTRLFGRVRAPEIGAQCHKACQEIGPNGSIKLTQVALQVQRSVRLMAEWSRRLLALGGARERDEHLVLGIVNVKKLWRWALRRGWGAARGGLLDLDLRRGDHTLGTGTQTETIGEEIGHHLVVDLVHASDEQGLLGRGGLRVRQHKGRGEVGDLGEERRRSGHLGCSGDVAHEGEEDQVGVIGGEADP